MPIMKDDAREAGEKPESKAPRTRKGSRETDTVDSVVTPIAPTPAPTPPPAPTPTIGPMTKEVYDAVNSTSSILDNPNMENISEGDIANATAHSKQTAEEKAKTQRSARNTYNAILDEIGDDVGVIGAAATGGTAGLGILGAVGAGFGAAGGALLAAFRNDSKELDRTNAIAGLERNGATSDEIKQALKKAGMSYSDYKANKETIAGIITAEESKGNPPPPSYKDNFVSTKGGNEVDANSGAQGTSVGEVVTPDPTQQPVASDANSRASGLMNYLNQLKYERDTALSNLSKTYASGLQQWSQQVGVPGEVGYIQPPTKPQQITMTPDSFVYGDQNLSTGQPVAQAPQANELTQEKISELAANPLTDWNTVGIIYGKDPEELKRLAGIQPVAQAPVTPVAPPTVSNVVDNYSRKGSNRSLV